MRKYLLLILICFTSTASAQYNAERYPVIPKPYTLLPFSGEFIINAETVIITDSKFYRKEIEHFRKEVLSLYGINLKYGKGKYSDNFIYVSQDSLDIPDEGYNLYVTRNEINLYGGHAGIFYGLQTLLQLIGHNDAIYDKDSNIVSANFHFSFRQHTVPSCAIIDQPRFAWRGMHLDVSRHFFPKDSVKEYLRYMALYKLNTFHWHLTDDQGWRIEIKKYPKLTSVGAWRTGTLIGHEGVNDPPVFDTIRHGGYYTQEDIREIVRYADSLHITIVPEIEMPGHALAMLSAYPELGCGGNSYAVSKTWGVFDDVLCPTEQTFTFLDNVLKEVCALFPGKYIHIGGDECPKARWRESAFCQNLMNKNNLKDENELQSWFTRRIVEMLRQKGKQAIGWDEILEGGLAEGAAVMSWRGEEGGIHAAKAKHNVVMSPGSHCYFDHYQSQSATEPLAIGGFLPLEKVYSYDPVPAQLNAEERKYIMGVQANVWTEYISTFSHVQYMIFPRMAALAEVAWTEPQNKNYNFFTKRLLTHFYLLERMKVNYAKSIFDIKAVTAPDPNGSGLLLSFSAFAPGKEIRYSTRSSSELWTKYTLPILIKNNDTIYAAVFDGTSQVSSLYTQAYRINMATGKNCTLRKQPSASYNYGGPTTLVDGIDGRKKPWLGSEWLGFSGDTLEATIDLGKDTFINTLVISSLEDHGSWIYAPTAVKFYSSADGKNFVPLTINKRLFDLVNNRNPYFPSVYPLEKVNARYVKIVLYPLTTIPEGSPGEGNPAWLFMSEIEIR
ncbi:MAG: glycoside hydrolase family 20 protein [Bacteroidota bacterium]|nr:glycoside hydrolase family 20 protein [Bacteroidota bacterium]